MILRLWAGMLFVLATVLFWSNNSLAQSINVSGTVTSTQSIAQPAVDPNLNTEVEVLRAQLELMREYDQRLLYTVDWAMGVVGGVLAIIVGYSALRTFVLSEREKRAVTAELEGVIRTRVVDAQARLEEANSYHLRQFEERFASQTQQIEEIAKKYAAETRVEIGSELAGFKSRHFIYRFFELQKLAMDHFDSSEYLDAIGRYLDQVELSYYFGTAEGMEDESLKAILGVYAVAEAAGTPIETPTRFVERLERLPEYHSVDLNSLVLRVIQRMKQSIRGR